MGQDVGDLSWHVSMSRRRRAVAAAFATAVEAWGFLGF